MALCVGVMDKLGCLRTVVWRVSREFIASGFSILCQKPLTHFSTFEDYSEGKTI